MVKYSFANDNNFWNSMEKSFQKFMNECSMTPHFIAAYCDNEFKKGLKGINEIETNARLNAIIDLFRCLYGRDIFIK